MGRQVVTAQDIIAARPAAAAQAAREAKGPQAAPLPSAQVVPPATTPATVAATPDGYTDRLVKYVPAEGIAVFLAVDGVLRGAADIPAAMLGWVVFGVLLVLLYFYQRNVLNVRKVQQHAIMLVAFVVWVFAIGGPFAGLSWYSPIYGALLVPLVTFGFAAFKAEA